MVSSAKKKNEFTDFRGLSTDTKPTDAENGASFIEMDTGAIYFFNAETKDWEEWG